MLIRKWRQPDLRQSNSTVTLPDMTKRTTIKVTEADIETAVPKDSGHCAIADAIARQIPGASRITVDLQSIRWTDQEKGERYVYLTPRVAQALLLDFDQGDRDNCQPLTFRLDNPVQVVPVRSFTSATSRKARQARLDNIRAQRDRGEPLTSDQQRSLARADAAATKPRRPRPSSGGRRTVERVGPDEHGDPAGAITVRGGDSPPLGALAHGPGRRRQFGIKSAGNPLPA